MTPDFGPDFILGPPAAPESVARAEAELGPLPDDYRAFLLRADGGEGPVGAESYLALWSVDDLAERNRGYKADSNYAPGLLLIGTDGGNEAFAIRDDGRYVSAPLIGMSPEAVVVCGSSLNDLVASLP